MLGLRMVRARHFASVTMVGTGCVGAMQRRARPSEFQIVYSAEANSRVEWSLTCT